MLLYLECNSLNVDFFFFSSRRRHTRLQGDWSSDVCSSDLAMRRASASPLRCRQPSTTPARRRRSPRRTTGNASASWVTPWSSRQRPAGDRRSGERRVGEEGRSPWGADHLKKKKKRK